MFHSSSESVHVHVFTSVVLWGFFDSCLLSVFPHSGLQGVSDLQYRSNDSTATWASSLGDHPGVAFLYELSLLNGTTLHRSQVNDTHVRLPGLEDSRSYLLDVWEQCDGRWKSEPSQLCIEGANSSLAMFLRAVGPILDQGRCRCIYDLLRMFFNPPGQLVIEYLFEEKKLKAVVFFFFFSWICRAAIESVQVWSDGGGALVAASRSAGRRVGTETHDEEDYQRKGGKDFIGFRTEFNIRSLNVGNKPQNCFSHSLCDIRFI